MSTTLATLVVITCVINVCLTFSYFSLKRKIRELRNGQRHWRDIAKEFEAISDDLLRERSGPK